MSLNISYFKCNDTIEYHEINFVGEYDNVDEYHPDFDDLLDFFEDEHFIRKKLDDKFMIVLDEKARQRKNSKQNKKLTKFVKGFSPSWYSGEMLLNNAIVYKYKE